MVCRSLTCVANQNEAAIKACDIGPGRIALKDMTTKKFC
jgi:hypothetical protein